MKNSGDSNPHLLTPDFMLSGFEVFIIWHYRVVYNFDSCQEDLGQRFNIDWSEDSRNIRKKWKGVKQQRQFKNSYWYQLREALNNNEKMTYVRISMGIKLN